MFSKHTFGARSYGHYQGYREKGEPGTGLTNAWRKMQKAKRLRAEALRSAKERRRLTKVQAKLERLVGVVS